MRARRPWSILLWVTIATTWRKHGVTTSEAIALLDEAERLIPPAGEGLPSWHDCRRLEEIANTLLQNPPVEHDRILLRAATVKNSAHSWIHPRVLGLHRRGEELMKRLVRRDLSDLREAVMERRDGPEMTEPRPGLIDALRGWLLH